MKPLTQSIKVQRVRRPAAFVQEPVLKSALLLFQEVIKHVSRGFLHQKHI